MSKIVQLNANVPEELRDAFKRDLASGKGPFSLRVIEAIRLWLDAHASDADKQRLIPHNEEEELAVQMLLRVYRSKSDDKKLVDLALRHSPKARKAPHANRRKD